MLILTAVIVCDGVGCDKIEVAVVEGDFWQPMYRRPPPGWIVLDPYSFSNRRILCSNCAKKHISSL